MNDDTRPAYGEKEQNMNISHGHELNERGSAGQHARIRELNDRLRTAGTGGKVVVTNGIAALEPATADRVLEAVRQFDAFGPDNDPWSEHDCASLTADGVKVIWKIDYFERSGRIHSPDPADPKVTLRVLTIMLADEY